ncbi:MAG TPA: ABC transporter permease, partial [Gemmatimonadaceae bacterium]|nr:ABC transporter permease [Gemmatimonadaceae bacterium]
MPWIRDKYRASHVLLHGEHPARDVTEEFEHHIAMRVEENVANGMSPSAARAEALARFGDMDAARTETRRIDEPALHSRRVGERLDTIAHDLRRALRSLARTPVFTLTAFLTLALGLGAMISFFAVLDAVVLHPLAYDHAEELVSIKHPVPGFKANEKWALSSAGYFHFRRESKTLADVGVYERSNVSVSSTGFAERANGAAVTASLLHVLRFRPRIGRLIQESDERASLRGRPAAVVMLGYDFWVGHFGADTNVVDRTLNYEGTPVPIIGVLEKGETLPDQRIDVWVPEQIRPDQRPVNSHHYRAIARLARGASPEAAQAELAGFVAQFTTLYPTAYDPGFMSHFRFGVDVAPLQRETLGGIGRVLWTLFGSVALVLLIACANVANLFLVRADTRQREAAIRIALGAGRGRLAWQYLTESLLLTIAAGVAGLAVAAALTHMVKLRAPSGLPRVGDLAVLPSTYAFALALSAVAGVVFALMQLGRSNAALASLREGGRGLTLSRRQHVVRGALVVAQLAFALVLLAAAGVMVKSFAHLRSVKPGLDPDNVLAFDVVLPQFKYRDWESVEQFHHRLSDRLAALPGVVAVGSGTKIPLDAPGGCSLVFKENWDSAREAAPCEDTPLVAPGYFRALRIPVRGREPGWLDVENRMGGVVVTSAFAARLWPNEDPIGKGI